MHHTLARLFVLTAAGFALYGAFLSSPPVFDDHDFFRLASEQRLRDVFQLRWLPNASIDLTRAWLGEDMIWLRLPNLALHIANAWLLFVFLRLLFDTVVGANRHVQGSGREPLSPDVMAFAAALLFLVHPVAVYGAAYAVQRSTLLSTLFALLTWFFFLKGATTARQRWLWASAAAYLLSAFSKEHAIMVPVVSLAVWLLVRGEGRASLRRIMPALTLYAAVAVLVMLQLRADIIGQAYEPNAGSMARELDPDSVYPLSVVTQSFLYFKYLFLWLIPLPGMMSIDIREPLAKDVLSWPHTAGAVAFFLLGVLALWLLLRKGRSGLAGFALLAPWLMFATELSSVRLQEVFVLYRSYLWMPCLGAAFPLLLHKIPRRHALPTLTAVALLFSALAWNRLTTFSDPLLLWDEALRLAVKNSASSDLGRMYHNRGVAYLDKGRHEEAIRDFDEGLRHLPNYSQLYNDRGVAHLYLHRYDRALADFDRAIGFNPTYYNPYLGRARVYEALGDMDAARQDYARSCRMGVTEVCEAR